jgi:hypothetical protein
MALLTGLFGIQLTQMALAATDGLCQVVVAADGFRVRGSFDSLAKGIVTPGAPQLVAGVISLLLIVGAVLLWLEMVLRAAAVYIAAFFMPLALACYVWPATAGVAKRALELLSALILSKFVIVATLTLGLSALDVSAPPDSPVVGGAILLLAGFAPFCLLRLAPVVETAAIAHLEGMSRRPARAVARAARTGAAAPGSPVVMRLLAMTPQRRAESQRPQAAAVVAQHIPDRPADYRTTSGYGASTVAEATPRSRNSTSKRAHGSGAPGRGRG